MQKNYLLMALIERKDGSTYTQCITYLTEDQLTKSFKDKAIEKFAKSLGKDYYICDTWIE